MTVHVAGTRGDALRVQVAGVDVQHLALVGTIRGVTPLAAGGRNGPGTGTLKSVGGPPARRFAWRRPGSATFGAEVTCASTGSYLLEDGEDGHAWLRVLVDVSWLPDAPQEARVFMRDRFNELGPDDVTSAEASAGAIETLVLALANVSPHQLRGVVAWLDASTTRLELSPDGAAWSAPTSEGAGIALGNVAVGASVALHVRRTVGAGAPSAAEVLNLIHLVWEGA